MTCVQSRAIATWIWASNWLTSSALNLVRLGADDITQIKKKKKREREREQSRNNLYRQQQVQDAVVEDFGIDSAVGSPRERLRSGRWTKHK